MRSAHGTRRYVGICLADLMEIRRLLDSGDCATALQAVEPLEPRTSLVAAALLRGPSRHRRLHVVEDSGMVAGVASIHQLCLDRWGANVVILDPEAAPLLAAVVDRSPARYVGGVLADVEPLVPHMTRAWQLSTMPWGGVAPPLPPARV